MVDVVHRGAANALVVPFESERLDQVDGNAEAGAETHDRADIAGDFGFVEGDAHGCASGARQGPMQAGCVIFLQPAGPLGMRSRN